jgi:GTP-binding protein EngB required for normal cell division
MTSVESSDSEDNIGEDEKHCIIDRATLIAKQTSPGYTRNVLFIGRPNTGKSTVRRVLQYIGHVVSRTSILNTVSDTTYHSFEVRDEKVDVNYIINVTDSKGIPSRCGKNGKEKTEQHLLDIITKARAMNVTRYHSVIMFLSVSAGIDEEDIANLEMILAIFGSSNVFLCITKTETTCQDERERIIYDITFDAIMGPIIAEMDNDILFMGCVDMNGCNPQREQIPKVFRRVNRDRNVFLTSIFMSNQPTILANRDFIRFHDDRIKRRGY